MDKCQDKMKLHCCVDTLVCLQGQASICLSEPVEADSHHWVWFCLRFLLVEKHLFLPLSPTTCSLVKWWVSINRLIKENVLDRLSLESVERWLLLWIDSVQINIDWFYSRDINTMYIFCFVLIERLEEEITCWNRKVIIFKECHHLCHTVLHQTTISCTGPNSSKLN